MGKIKRNGFLALSPIAVLLTVYLAGSIIAGDFYKIPITAAFLVASVYAIAITRGGTLSEKIDTFSNGVANSRLLLMVWIFVLAGSFAAVAKSMGAVDATVALTLELIPGNYLPAGIFIAACFISMSIGTSVGTIVALAPVVTALAAQVGCDTAWMVAIVVGGAFFGDNLSFISDTTIVATQTQGCEMKDKFKTNFLLVLPVTLFVIVIYLFTGSGIDNVPATEIGIVDCIKVLPYILVIITALCGVNVLLVLVFGIIASGAIGVATGSFGIIEIFTTMGNGITSMAELIIVTMLAGGLLEIVRVNGGLDFLIKIVTFRVQSKRAAEFAIVNLTALSNLCTANNTIAILTAGDVSRDIAKRFGIAPRRSASLMDTTSCFVQGVIPYGAQLLMAAGLASVSPVAIIPHLYYPMGVGIMVILSILFRFPTCRN
ncbi:MAG: Na+/H+ antiporter NhaC family protein [Bacteroidaceae bacterium]|nr:Na+/H+ antiporter NhaC family protein [Bacteroidaceae bacterium]